MLGIDAKDDRLLEGVAAFLEELAYRVGDACGALVDDESAVEILLIVVAVFDLMAVPVFLAGKALPGSILGTRPESCTSRAS